MSVCFKSFDASHNFSRTAAPVRNHVTSMSQTNLLLNKLSEWMMKSSCCEFFTVLYFEIKCSNNKKDSFDFSCQDLFLPLVCVIILVRLQS